MESFEETECVSCRSSSKLLTIYYSRLRILLCKQVQVPIFRIQGLTTLRIDTFSLSPLPCRFFVGIMSLDYPDKN